LVLSTVPVSVDPPQQKKEKKKKGNSPRKREEERKSVQTQHLLLRQRHSGHQKKRKITSEHSDTQGEEKKRMEKEKRRRKRGGSAMTAAYLTLLPLLALAHRDAEKIGEERKKKRRNRPTNIGGGKRRGKHTVPSPASLSRALEPDREKKKRRGKNRQKESCEKEGERCTFPPPLMPKKNSEQGAKKRTGEDCGFLQRRKEWGRGRDKGCFAVAVLSISLLITSTRA